MSDTAEIVLDPPALRRLAELEARPSRPPRPPRPVRRPRRPVGSEPRRGVRPMGYQPGLDGLRALSVLAVIAYHAGFSWMPGGFFGVEVFFVVSGFLITSLLLDERGREGVVSLRRFWARRARRLLPALGMLLAAVSVWALIAGSAEQASQVRRDLPWAIFYVGNWGQISGGVPYYSADPPLLRHLWSLAVEEQWYLLWPIAFVALAATRWSRDRCAAVLAALAVAGMVLAFWLHARGPGPVRSSIGWIDGADRVNFMYLATPTRATGLLLGAAAAFVWRPWTLPSSAAEPEVVRRAGRLLDGSGAVALAGLGCIAASATLTEGYVYQWLLPLVTVLSLVAVLVVVHPAAGGLRASLGWSPLVAIGQRSYGLYLWHWPIFVVMGATHGSVARVLPALAVTAIVSEACYRWVELPVRQGALGRWWASDRKRAWRLLGAAAAGVMLLVVVYANVQPFDRAAGGEEAALSVPATSVPARRPAEAGPVAVAIVGDSQAHSLAINQPAGLDSTLTVSDGSLSGCSIYDRGRVYSAREGFDNSFSMCEGWQDKWAEAADGASVALVAIGAWDVFDLDDGDRRLVFGTPEWDAYFTASLQSGIDALSGAGARVALLEVPCMRPQSVEGAGVPPLPERADDARVAHLNDLMRAAAASHAATTRFVEGPDEWCTDETVATDLAYRWDGVHVYKPGAALIFERVAPELVAMAG
jgi:peptidoglycan/LPS O-acetylase OafA/YrhL